MTAISVLMHPQGQHLRACAPTCVLFYSTASSTISLTTQR